MSYRVVIRGVLSGFTLEQVIGHLAPLFKVTADSLRPQLQTQNFVAKAGVDLQTAAKYENLLRQHGCMCVVEPEQDYTVNVNYSVFIRGVLPGFTQEQAAEQLAPLFKTGKDALRAQLQTRNFMTKRGVDLQTAAKYDALLQQHGCASVVEPEYIPTRLTPEPVVASRSDAAEHAHAETSMESDDAFMAFNQQLASFLAAPDTPAPPATAEPREKAEPIKIEAHYALEKFPRIMDKIKLLWGHPECEVLISSLVIDDRGNRQGFGMDIMDELLFLTQITTLVCPPKKDIWTK